MTYDAFVTYGFEKLVSLGTNSINIGINGDYDDYHSYYG